MSGGSSCHFLWSPVQITLGDGELERHCATTEELRQCCLDIRVLGRKELRYVRRRHQGNLWAAHGGFYSCVGQADLTLSPSAQGPAELENKASAISGQEAEGASQGAGHQVGGEAGQLSCSGEGPRKED